MNLKIIAVGNKMPAWVQQGYDDFAKRIQPLQSLELIEVPLPKRSRNSSVDKLKFEEAEAIERKLKGTEKLVILDVKGKSFSTQQLAGFIQDWQMQGQDIALIIGGPDGLDPRFLNGAYTKLSLSQLTMPHPLVRLLIVEQIYRAISIIANHPYHRE